MSLAIHCDLLQLITFNYVTLIAFLQFIAIKLLMAINCDKLILLVIDCDYLGLIVITWNKSQIIAINHKLSQ